MPRKSDLFKKLSASELEKMRFDYAAGVVKKLKRGDEVTGDVLHSVAAYLGLEDNEDIDRLASLEKHRAEVQAKIGSQIIDAATSQIENP